MNEHLDVAVLPFPKFGKFGKYAPAVAIPLGFTVLSGALPRGKRMIRQLKLCRVRLPHRQWQQEPASRRRRDPKLAMRTAVTALRQRSGRGDEEDCNHSRAALLRQSHGQVREGRDLSEEIPPLLTYAVCFTPGSSDIYFGGL